MTSFTDQFGERKGNKKVSDIREEFARLYTNGAFVTDKTGVQVVEVIGASFVANEDSIFGTPNGDYIARELTWYNSQSLNVNDIPPPVPVIWQKCATPDGFINSNYGWCIFSEANGSQFDNVVKELNANPFSRRAEMIYTRPSMHSDYNRNGMSDFICTEAVQYFIRDGSLHTVVKMRSNDAVYGYNNDYAWQKYVQLKVLSKLNDRVVPGNIYWNAGSLHVYSRHFNLIEEYIKQR